ncbi:MAG TPA: efflux RND transporter periplasmic adaptor subunit, partial [Cystobacter sp.]
VKLVRLGAQTVQNVVTYDAVIDVQNPEMKLKPGMTANVNIVTARGENVLTVPNAALRFRPPAPPEGGRPGGRKGADGQAAAAPPPPGTKTVYVLRQGRPERVNVKAGVTDGSYTEVEGELNEGDQVITALSTAAGTGAAPGAGAGQRPGGGGGGFGGGRRGGGPF